MQSLTNATISFRWFCHFDDDVYVNIPNLVSALRKVVKGPDDGVYFGRWPANAVGKYLKDGVKVCVKLCYMHTVTLNSLAYSRFQNLDFTNLELRTM